MTLYRIIDSNDFIQKEISESNYPIFNTVYRGLTFNVISLTFIFIDLQVTYFKIHD